MKKSVFFLLIMFLTGVAARPATCKAVANGSWGNVGTWDCGRAPAGGDSLIIPAGITVNIDANYDYANEAAIKIDISGTLAFDNGHKLKLACGSEIWVEVGGKIIVTGGGSSNTIDICGTTVWSSDFGNVSGYQYLSPTSVMPIELKTFYALPESNKVRLHWETATETNNKEFTVEKSKDAINYSTLAVIPSKANQGNSMVALSYEYVDQKPTDGISYYRFKQTDHNGKYKYFQAISVDLEGSKHIVFTVYPNPNQGQFTVDFTGVENNHEIEVIMHDQQGKLAFRQSIMSESLATNTFSIIPDQQIASGVYMVNFVVEGVKYPVKVIVQ